MVFGSIIPQGNLTLQQTLNLARIYLDNARNSTDNEILLALCRDAETALTQAKKSVKHTKGASVHDLIATIHIELSELLEVQGYQAVAKVFQKRSEKWGGKGNEMRPTLSKSIRPISIIQSLKPTHHLSAKAPMGKSSSIPSSVKQHKGDMADLPSEIFAPDTRAPATVFELPETYERINNTPQLACSLGLVRSFYTPDDIRDTATRNWLQDIRNNPDERERLKLLATDVVRVFKHDEFGDAKAIAEVVCLASVLEKDDYTYLLSQFYRGIDHTDMLNVHQLEGLARLLQGADSGYLGPKDLIKARRILSKHLQNTNHQATKNLHQVTLAAAHMLDAMADAETKGLDHMNFHEPFSSYLEKLKSSSDPYLVYQAAYASQALLCVPDDETLWQATLRRTGKVIQGVSGLVNTVKGLDLNGFIDGLMSIRPGSTGVPDVDTANPYDDAILLAKSGQRFSDRLKESFSQKCAWYPALRGADILVQDGHFPEFKKLVCKAPCRRDAAFQWGVCQRLGDIATNSMWNADTRRNAIAFLGEIYKNDSEWGSQATIKQWIVNILLQISSSGDEVHAANAQLKELEKNGDAKKQTLFRACRENGPGSYPLNIVLPAMGTPSLFDRVRARPDIEGNLHLLRKRRLKERGSAVYIPPQAKAGFQASDNARFPLMDSVMDFLSSDRKVFLLLGDPGTGKSTFSRQLELDLWDLYKSKTGTIPLHINLPAIIKPEHDMIAKQLRTVGFTESQIREVKHYRKFVLICNGYDEILETPNLYMSNRFGQPGEWDAQMVINCRSEYLEDDYRDWFRPGDRSQMSDSLYQEVVIAPFSVAQMEDFINQYVSLYEPQWREEDYSQALNHIPSLKQLVRNPFLMTLSLEVLPRMMTPGEQIATHITKVALYDQFIEHLLEQGKKRIEEKVSSTFAVSALGGLTNDRFTRKCIDYFKKLCVAIYKEQDGQPIITYQHNNDEVSWKTEFFSGEDKQLLREACPLVRDGNQYRFIDRSLLEYGIALATFDPQDTQGSVSAAAEESLLESPLAWRSFVDEPSVLQFLEERYLQESSFQEQLRRYIDLSKEDEKWSTAAANAITTLIRADVEFNGEDLQGIRIRGADLSNGMFDSAQLQGADLRDVKLHNVWLRQANLSGAQMEGVLFDEFPYLLEDSAVRCCTFSTAGDSLAVGLSSGDIRVYGTSDWKEIGTLSGHTSEVTSVVYSRKDDQLASCGVDKTVRLWDADTGACRILRGHGDWVNSVAYSPQDNTIATASDDGTVKLWEVESGTCSQTLDGHEREVTCAMYSPKGDIVVSGSKDRTVRLWEVETGNCRRILESFGGMVIRLVYSPQGDQLASYSIDDVVHLWDVETGKCNHSLSGHTSKVSSIVFSPTGDLVVSGSEDMTVRIWDAITGTCLRTLSGHVDRITSVAVSQTDLVASAGHDRTVRLWSLRSGVSRDDSSGHNVGVLSVENSPKGDQAASCSWDGTVRIWDLKNGSCLHVLQGHKRTAGSTAYSPDGEQLATGSWDNTIKVWDMRTGKLRLTLTGHSKMVNAVVYSPKGDLIASAGDDETVCLWTVDTGTCRSTLRGHSGTVESIAYSPSGNQIASGSYDNTVRLWDVEEGACLQTLGGHKGAITIVIYSPKGDEVASGSRDTTLRLWNEKNGGCRHTLRGHTGWITSINYSKYGQIVSGSKDHTARIWDVAKGTCLKVLTGHVGSITKVVFSPRGDLISSGSVDRTVRLWDVVSGECAAAIRDFHGSIRGISWSTNADGTYLVTGSNDKSVRAWVVSGEEGQRSVRLHWSSSHDALAVTDVSIQDVQGLSIINKQLLKQRGGMVIGSEDDQRSGPAL